MLRLSLRSRLRKKRSKNAAKSSLISDFHLPLSKTRKHSDFSSRVRNQFEKDGVNAAEVKLL